MLPSIVVVSTLILGAALAESTVFLQRSAAGQILRPSARKRRGNSNLLEELFPGDLERECYEERCSQEEAAEIFQSQEKTMEFWFRYTNMNPCRTNPCLNGGMCTMERGHFLCLCPPRFHGETCHSEVSLCRYKNGGCLQYCTDLPGGAGVQCGCADGFKLDSDGRRCSKTDQVNVTVGTNVTWDDNYTHSWFNWTRGSEEVAVNSSQLQEVGGASGLAEGLSPRIVGGTLEKPGGSPWQVLIRRVDGYGFCGGTLVSDRWVLSAAHCFQQRAHHVTIGDYDKQRKDPGEQMIKVQQVLIHPYFHSFTLDSDIALLYLARPIVRGPTAIPACLPDPHLSTYLLQGDNRGVVTGWGTTKYLGRSSRFLRKVALPVVSHHSCSLSSEQVITDNMFCAGYLKASSDACSGDSGGPFVVNYRGTWFLTGIISWGEECAASGKYGVYTRLGNFLTWIRTTMARVDLNATQS
ncbi:venom prothrombin activator porpharin-D isoform X2 [Dunckerocampus dactyliophorus]|uniref:venom prothrombin activator porpharin-D isoform X2 n=1 Tax=Dunckerocampus dactyliophorus TaxID=161453 RepID=UPI002405094F|nr:venom prothrombin activator porpharin-D isoform X2 [Dunckerocampus dactyliophorus]